MTAQSFKAIPRIAIIAILAACSGGNPHNMVPAPSQQQAQNNVNALGSVARTVRYNVIDLGTFGGPTAYGSVNGPSTSVLNGAGVAAAPADTALPDPFAPQCFLDCFVVHAFRWHNGVLTDLGALANGESSAAGDINARGWVIGQSQYGRIDPFFGSPATRSVLWNDISIVDLGTLGGATGTATEINDGGEVVGFSETGAPDPFLGAQFHDFLWVNGKMKDIGTLGGPDTLPFFGLGCGTCINNRGEITGSSFTNSVANATTGIPTFDPFIWRNGNMTDIGGLGGTLGSPYHMNDRGQIVGISDLAGDTEFHPFIWDGSMRDLGTLGGDDAQPFWNNENGDVVGDSDVAGNRVRHAFLWRKGTMTDLGTLGTFSVAFAINDKGQIVGFSGIDASTVHAVMWDNGGITDLNSVIVANAPFVLVAALNINNRGEIFGQAAPLGLPAQPDAFGDHDVLLVPCGNNGVACGAAPALRSTADRHRMQSVTRMRPLFLEMIRSRIDKRVHLPVLKASAIP